MSQESAVAPRDAVVADGPGSGGAGTPDSSDLEGGGWVVVTETTAQEARGAVEAEVEADAEDAAEAEACLKLKKKVWQARICQRRSAKKIAEAEDLEERTVEAYAAEVEALRNQLGLQWTWFEEELKTGAYDDRLRRRPKSAAGGTAAPEPGDASAFPSLASMLGANGRAGKKGQKSTPSSSAKSTPKLKPKLAPPLSPTLAPAKESWSERPMPPPEVWLAAKEHRKTNFFAAAVLGEAKSGNHMLLSVLRCVEASGAIDLGLSSRGFAAALLAAGAASELWRILGSGNGRMLQGAGAAPEGRAAPVFAGDPVFRLQSWARQRAFASRVAGGAARPAVLAPTLPELAFPEVELGPFLPSAVGCTGLADAPPERLLVSDGRQTFHVVDVSQRGAEGVQVDRFHSRTLRSSLGAHPVSVTASWPAGPQARSVVANGVVAARPRMTRGVATREAVAAFQWLELPEFEAGSGEPSEVLGQAAVAPTAKPSSSSPTTPELQPAAAPVATAGAAKPKPTAKSLQPPGKAKLQTSSSAGSSLIRASVPQERVAAALAGGAPGGAGAVEVDTVWPLPGHRLLILVRETSGTPPLGPSHSPAVGPARSPGMGPVRSPGTGPARSPGLGPAGSPSTSPPVSNGTSPQVGPGPASRRQDGGLTSLELPGLACQANSRGEEATSHGEYHLQVWEVPSSASDSYGKAAPELLASAHVSARVTCIHATASQGDSKTMLLCGLAHGGAELRELPLRGPPAILHRWPAVEASGGAAAKVLLRACGGGRDGSGAAEAAIVAQAGSVALYDARLEASKDPARVLPVEGFESSPRVSALESVGAQGFAVCSDAYVYAFAVSAATAGGPPAAELLAAVRLPVLEGPREGPEGPAVRHFHATPYEFLAVLEESAAADPEKNALCGLWPEDGLQVSANSSTATGVSAGAGGDSENEEGDSPSKKACYMQLRAWARKGEGFLRQLEAPTVVLNRTLFGGKGASPSISSVAFLDPETADEGILRPCPWGRGCLAAAAPGVGVAVFRWGVEASPELERYRELRRQQAAEEARQREREGMRRQLQRLQQRLQETDRLEERLRANGPETLTEEEHAKLQRRSQVERDCDRLSQELGLDVSEGSDHSDEEEGGEDKEKSQQVVAIQRRREKERQQKEHHVHKRDLQKERRMNRERKFVED